MKSIASISLIVCHLFIFNLCFAQTGEIDTVKKKLLYLKDTAQIDCLNEISYLYTLAKIRDSAEEYSNIAFEKASKINYAAGIAVSLSVRCYIAAILEANFAESEILGKESLKWYKKTTNKNGLDFLYNQLWVSTFAQGKYDEAIEYAQEMYQFLEAKKDKTSTWTALHMIAIVYKEAGNYEKSFDYNARAYQVAVTDRKTVLPQTLFLFGELYTKMGDYPTALNHFRKAFLLNNPENEEMLTGSGWDIWVKMEFAEVFSLLHQFDSAWHYYHLFKPENEMGPYYRIYLVSTGECYFLQKKYQNALQNFTQGLALHNKANDQNQVMRTLLDMAQTYVELTNNHDALIYARRGLAIAIKHNAKQYISNGYQILYSTFDRQHQKDSANFYFRKYATAKEEVLNDQTKAKFAAYNYEQQIAMMNTEKRVSQQQLQLKQQQLLHESQQKKNLIAGLFTILLLAVVGVRSILLGRRREQQQLKHEMKIEKLEHEKIKAEFQRQSAELEMQALRAQMNPHFIFNSLNCINMFILENNKLQASEYLSKFSRLVRLILQNSQEAFIPLEKELEALQLYLELESLRFEKGFEYRITVHDDIDTALLKVPPLIIQPYAENAIWHGLMHKKEKRHLVIELGLDKEILFYKITDDGVGRNKAAELKSKSAASHKSMGMRITTDRLLMLQKQNEASITIIDLVLADGNPGGTEVLLKLPVCYD
jgi:tetratricopeptide (TPR) repeat protein